MLTWLLQAGIEPAVVALPVNWAAATLAGASQRWFRRLRGADDLSRLVRAATGNTITLSKVEFADMRRLLENEGTWTMIGHGTVDDLANHIAFCMPAREDRTEEESHLAALALARGLLEFAVADLDPKLFQQVLLARLDRLETDQASLLDGALFDLHADLTAALATQGEIETELFSRVNRQLQVILERLPPGAADRGEVVAYLTTLIDWLNRDPWPQDRRFDGPVLTPAAIERKLRLAPADGPLQRDLDADELAKRCSRLAVLGDPGSGKTWMAKRTARRCAEDALAALAGGGTLDEVELPLYTTCSHLFNAQGNIRTAAVSSALDQLADLGGSRLTAAVAELFTERNAPTLLVIDSLDEAGGGDEGRLRQVDTLPWRIVLTSRPTSWN